MRVSILVAMAENGVIGRNGKLPWRLSRDLRRFKQLTMGHTIIMGRRTWESIGRPLPDRRTIVISRKPDYQTGHNEVAVVASLEAAIEHAKSAAEDEAFIVGGAEIYRLALPLADRLYLTRVVAETEGDTYFPIDDLNWKDWGVVSTETYDADPENEYPQSFEILQRREGAGKGNDK